MTSFYFNVLFKGPTSKHRHILRSWGSEIQQMNLLGQNSVHNSSHCPCPKSDECHLLSPQAGTLLGEPLSAFLPIQNCHLVGWWLAHGRARSPAISDWEGGKFQKTWRPQQAKQLMCIMTTLPGNKLKSWASGWGLPFWEVAFKANVWGACADMDKRRQALRFQFPTHPRTSPNLSLLTDTCGSFISSGANLLMTLDLSFLTCKMRSSNWIQQYDWKKGLGPSSNPTNCSQVT